MAHWATGCHMPTQDNVERGGKRKIKGERCKHLTDSCVFSLLYPKWCVLKTIIVYCKKLA